MKLSKFQILNSITAGDDPEDADFDPNYDGDQGGGTRQEVSFVISCLYE